LVDPEDLIDSRIGVHDDNQFEVKLDYVIDPAARSNRYQVETYFFIPRSLGVDPHSYTREQFYADMQAYIRFKTPTVVLSALVDPTNGRSPLNRIPKLLAKTRGTAAPLNLVDPLSHELRLLGCLMRANTRDMVAEISKRMESLDGRASERRVLVGDLRTGIESVVRDAVAVVERFRELRPSFMRPRRPQWVRELYAYTDEYISITVESYLTVIVRRIDADPQLRRALETTRRKVVRFLAAEQEHRRGAGYAAVLSIASDNRSYVYRQSALKKFMSSVLFLDINKEQEGRRITHVVAGIAAGVAMLFSTIAAIWSQSKYGINSFAFVVAIVVSYVFKDRIKEWLRTYFSNKLTRWLSDYDATIHDPVNNIVVGRCRETFNYIHPLKVPQEIYEWRHADATSVLEAESKPEVVIKYVKQITIRGRRIANFHGRLHDINDIIRFNVAGFSSRMDDPTRRVDIFDPEADVVRTVECPKAYHINVVMVLTAEGRAASIERFRVILDKGGIRELQEVQMPPPRALRVAGGKQLFAPAAAPNRSA
jgi:hypothetical protein